MKFICQIALVLVALHLIEAYAECYTDSDCRFGRCDLETGTCLCSQDCDQFLDEGVYQLSHCSNRIFAKVNLCLELQNACVQNTNYQLKKVTASFLDIFSDDCNTIFDSENYDTESFCEDQSYCNGNGICLQSQETTNMYCVCNNHFQGQRCGSRIVNDAQSLIRRLFSKKK